MKNTMILSLLAIELIASGCASTKTQTESVSKIGDGKFVQMYGGLGEVHKYSGLQCPYGLGDMQFDKTYMYNPNGTDVSCGWREGADRRYVTVYATRRPNVNFSEDWQNTLAVVNQVETQSGLTLDAEKSQACTLTGLISVAGKAADGNAASGDVFKLETAVFTSEEATSVVAYHPAAGGWRFKVRSTRPVGAGRRDETYYLEMCNEASEITQSQSANITKAGWK